MEDPTICGRFTFCDPSRVAAFDLVESIPELLPRYDTAPSQTTAVVASARSLDTNRDLLK